LPVTALASVAVISPHADSLAAGLVELVALVDAMGGELLEPASACAAGVLTAAWVGAPLLLQAASNRPAAVSVRAVRAREC
jgi:hypothetical protein